MFIGFLFHPLKHILIKVSNVNCHFFSLWSISIIAIKWTTVIFHGKGPIIQGHLEGGRDNRCAGEWILSSVSPMWELLLNLFSDRGKKECFLPDQWCECSLEGARGHIWEEGKHLRGGSSLRQGQGQFLQRKATGSRQNWNSLAASGWAVILMRRAQ